MIATEGLALDRKDVEEDGFHYFLQLEILLLLLAKKRWWRMMDI
jgi:hypothetical protein